MYGWMPEFIKHGETHHPDHYLSGQENGSNLKFVEKRYWCPLDENWYSNLKWLSRTIHKFGVTNEAYYLRYGQEFLPDIWNKNMSDPVLGDARNHSACLQCGGLTKFDRSKWTYPAFCSFSCSTSWYARNTGRVEQAMEAIRKKQAIDPTFLLRPSQRDYWIVKHGLTVEEAKLKVIERQTTNSLEAFIRRAGGDVEEGGRMHAERQAKWLASLEARGWFGNRSDISRRLFEAIERQSNIQLIYGDREASVKVAKHVFKLDCMIPGSKKAIEFFGNYWHANPHTYPDDHPIRRLDEGGFITAGEIRVRDELRLQLLREAGFDVLVVWEMEYTNDPVATIDRCVSFLNSACANSQEH